MKITVLLVFERALLKLLSNKVCKKSINFMVTCFEFMRLKTFSFNSIFTGCVSLGNNLLYYSSEESITSLRVKISSVSNIKLWTTISTSIPKISFKTSPAFKIIKNYTILSYPCGQLLILIKIDFNLGYSSISSVFSIDLSTRNCKILE